MSWLLSSAQGEALAVVRDQLALPYYVKFAEFWFADAADCGHPRATGWIELQYPLVVREISEAERAEILEGGTPSLQREP